MVFCFRHLFQNIMKYRFKFRGAVGGFSALFILTFLFLFGALLGWYFLLSDLFPKTISPLWIGAGALVLAFWVALFAALKSSKNLFSLASRRLEWSDIDPGSLIRVVGFVSNFNDPDDTLVLIHPVYPDGTYRLQDAFIVETSQYQLGKIYDQLMSGDKDVLFLAGTTKLISGEHIKYRNPIWPSGLPVLSDYGTIDLDFFFKTEEEFRRELPPGLVTS